MVAGVCGLHSAACASSCVRLMTKVIALVVEKSLSGLHNLRLDNVLGQ